MTVEVLLSNCRGRLLVDDADLSLVQDYKWSLGAKGYAVAQPSHRSYIYAHRLIMGAPDNLEVDHINGNGLDCRKQNLRLATHQQNTWNRHGPNKNNTHQYMGVSRYRKGWQAQIQRSGKRYTSPTYATEEEAARAYDVAARTLFGEFAYQNFPS
jgi:HNH endonuclease/AP2 domain